VSWSRLLPPPFESLRDGFGLRPSETWLSVANNREDSQPLPVDGEIALLRHSKEAGEWFS
jgi:hypothetical protein